MVKYNSEYRILKIMLTLQYKPTNDKDKTRYWAKFTEGKEWLSISRTNSYIKSLPEKFWADIIEVEETRKWTHRVPPHPIVNLPQAGIPSTSIWIPGRGFLLNTGEVYRIDTSQYHNQPIHPPREFHIKGAHFFNRRKWNVWKSHSQKQHRHLIKKMQLWSSESRSLSSWPGYTSLAVWVVFFIQAGPVISD